MLYENTDKLSIKLKKPMCLNGITDFIKRADLAERCLFFQTVRIPADRRRAYNEYWQDFERDKPYILAGIFDLLSSAMATVEDVKLSECIRMAEFHKLGYTIAEAMGGFGEEFNQRLKANKVRQLEITYRNSVVIQLLDDYLESGEAWDGTMSSLYKHLRDFMNEDATDDLYNKSQYPKDAARLGGALRELEGALDGYGISLEFYHNSEKYSCVSVKKMGVNNSEPIVRVPITGFFKNGEFVRVPIRLGGTA